MTKPSPQAGNDLDSNILIFGGKPSGVLPPRAPVARLCLRMGAGAPNEMGTEEPKDNQDDSQRGPLSDGLSTSALIRDPNTILVHLEDQGCS